MRADISEHYSSDSDFAEVIGQATGMVQSQAQYVNGVFHVVLDATTPGERGEQHGAQTQEHRKTRRSHRLEANDELT